MKFEYRNHELSNAIIDIAAGPFGSNLKVSCFTETGFPIIDGANLKGITVTDNITKFVSEDKARSLHRSIAKRRDIVVTISGNVGQISYIPDNSQYAEYLCSQRQFRVTFDESKIYVPYLVYYLHSVEGQSKILAFANQTGVPALSQPLKNFRKIKMDLPSLKNQHKIADVLSTLDEKIATNRAINDNLEQQAQAIFKSWFVEFEPFNGTMPSDWEIVPLEKIADFQNGYAFKSKELLNEPSPDCYQVFKQGHIARGGGFIPDGTKSWYPKSFGSKLEKFVLKKGDILMAMTDMKDNVAILGNTAVMPLDNEYIVNQRVGHLRANGYKGVTYPFIYLLTNSTDFLVDLRSRANSGVQVNLSSSEIKASQTVLPSEEVNNAFSEITLPMFEIIINNQLENQRLAQLRDTLLPKLMSGELDVSAFQL